MKYKIEIHSQGYEDHCELVERSSMAKVSKTDILRAKLEWCKLNDVDEDSIELPFHRITRLN